MPLEDAIMAISAFLPKYDTIVADRRISGIAFEPGEIRDDVESMEATNGGSNLGLVSHTQGGAGAVKRGDGTC